MLRVLMCAVLSLAMHHGLAAESAGRIEVGDVVYEVVHGWPQLPEGFALGTPGGIDADAQGRIFSIHAAGRVWPERDTPELISEDTVLVWDADTGEHLYSWGANQFRMTHGLTVDDEGYVWATDVGLHQVFKFTAEGELLFALGEPGVPGSEPGYFNLPTDVAVLPDGSFYVSDGYGNNRIVKYSADGEYQFEWGEAGSGPGQFNLPHSVALDSEGRVYVADRSNFRVQVFTPEGEYIREFKTIGWRPYAMLISEGDRSEESRIVITDGGDKPATFPFRSRVVMLDMEGNILETFGRYGNYDGQFKLAHDIGFGRDGSIYIADVVGDRIQKFVVMPQDGD